MGFTAVAYNHFLRKKSPSSPSFEKDPILGGASLPEFYSLRSPALCIQYKHARDYFVCKLYKHARGQFRLDTAPRTQRVENEHGVLETPRTKSDDKTMHTNVLFFGFSFISPLFMPESIRKDYTPFVFER